MDSNLNGELDKNNLSIYYHKVFLNDKFISALGPCKPVATAPSGPLVNIYMNGWLALSDENKEIIYNRLKKAPNKNFTLGVHISELSPEQIANKIIFYSIEHLDIIADIYGKKTCDILGIIESRGKKTEEEKDIIMIAFGNAIYGNDLTQLSEMGNINYDIYLSYVGKTREESEELKQNLLSACTK